MSELLKKLARVASSNHHLNFENEFDDACNCMIPVSQISKFDETEKRGRYSTCVNIIMHSHRLKQGICSHISNSKTGKFQNAELVLEEYYKIAKTIGFIPELYLIGGAVSEIGTMNHNQLPITQVINCIEKYKIPCKRIQVYHKGNCSWLYLPDQERILYRLENGIFNNTQRWESKNRNTENATR